MNRPYLSICIPTYERLDIMRNTLSSIYSDISDVCLDDFEVIISDNSPQKTTQSIVGEFKYKNLYYHPTNCEGFLNSYYALTYGKGYFLKLHNNYTKFRKGTLKKIIDSVKENVNEQPGIFYTNGLRRWGDLRIYNSFDSYNYDLSYLSSWSSGFGIWKDDLIDYDAVSMSKMFPQTTLFFSQVNKRKFIINDSPIFDNQTVAKKGGYNIFRVFGVEYVAMVHEQFMRGNITSKTFEKIKSDLMLTFFVHCYFKSVYLKMNNYDLSNIKESLSVYYKKTDYYKLRILALFYPLSYVYQKIKIKILYHR